MTTKLFSFCFIFVAIFSTVSAQESKHFRSAKNDTVLTIGGDTGSNAIPFDIYETRYQQIYYPWAFPPGPVKITAIAFTSNPADGTGTVQLNVTLRLGTLDTIYPVADFDFNIQKATVVYNGPIVAVLDGSVGDLRFPLMHPYHFHPTHPNQRSLVLDVEVHDVQGPAFGYLFGLSSEMGRVYRNLADGNVTVESNVGLTTRFEIK